MKLSKEETIQFIAFLQEREIQIAQYAKTSFSMFNGRHTRDCTPLVKKVVAYIKEHTPEEAYSNGLYFLQETTRNCNYKKMPQIAYVEDLQEYLDATIADAQQRQELLECIVHGKYKTAYAQKRHPEVSENLHQWALANKDKMLTRERWQTLFAFEFQFWLDEQPRYRHLMPKL